MKTWHTLLAASAALAVGIGAAQAAPMPASANLSQFVTGNSYTVTVWNGTGVTKYATLSNEPSTPALATFTYTGNIDFTNNSGNNGQNALLNTFQDFGFSSSNISNYTGSISETQLLGTTMSLSGEVYNTYLSFTGMYSGPALWLSIGHDDGASFYTGSGNTAVIQDAGPNSYTTSSNWLSAGNNTPFTLTYVESNGSPADLVATLSGPALPEPGTLVMFAAGLLGMGWMLRRRKAS